MRATPGDWSWKTGGVFVEQVVRPTGLIDPECVVRPVESRVDDLLAEAAAPPRARVLVTTLTKRMAEDLTEYMHDQNIRARYLHSDIDTLERIEIIRDLRLGVRLSYRHQTAREGLDIPECALVAILDADKEGFYDPSGPWSNHGRAARNIDGRVIRRRHDRKPESRHWRDQPPPRPPNGLQLNTASPRKRGYRRYSGKRLRAGGPYRRRYRSGRRTPSHRR